MTNSISSRAICHWSFLILQNPFLRLSAVVRKNAAPASSRQTVLLTQKELSRLTCRRDAGATILSHDPRLCGEIAFGHGYAAPSSSHPSHIWTLPTASFSRRSQRG